MLPLVFILAVTAIKDGVEDYRRAVVDDQVNNSAATKLGDWRNLNQPKDGRSWFEKAFGLNKPGKVSKGVKKLRAREAKEEGDWGRSDAEGRKRIVLQKTGESVGDDDSSDERTATGHDQVVNLTQVHTKGQWPSESTITIAASSNAHLTSPPKGGDTDYAYGDTNYNHTSYPPVPPIPSYLRDESSSGGGAVRRARSQSFGASSRRSRRTNGPSSSSYPDSRKSSVSGVIDYSARTPGTAHWERTLWKKLEVGDVVLLRDNDQVPADIVVLNTSEEDGLCYLETKNLDGETNLKPRKSLRGTSSVQSEEDVERARFVLDSEPPHANLYLYNGVLRYRDSTTGADKREPVTINELLLRGCSVRNTSWIIGLVVFTGADTKIMMNGGSTPSKRSKIERETNFNVVMNFVVLIGMCLASAIASGVIGGQSDTSADFFEVDSEPSDSNVVNAIVTFA
jgi:phospholipid-translocating ATPase